MQVRPFGLLRPTMVFEVGRMNFRRVFLKIDTDFELRTLMSSLFHSSIVEEINEFSNEFPFDRRVLREFHCQD